MPPSADITPPSPGCAGPGPAAAVRRGVPRQGARAPSRAGSRPDSGCPLPKNLVRASSVIIGLVKVNTTTTSMIVVRPRVNAKPRTLADREVVQQRGGQEGHGVGDQDRPPGPAPAALHRRPQRAPLADLVAESFEEDHERVRGDADRHDQAGDAGQGQREALVLAEHDDRQVGEQPRDHQAEHRDDRQAPVVQQQVDHHQQEAEGGRDQARRRAGRGPAAARPTGPTPGRRSAAAHRRTAGWPGWWPRSG